MNNHAPPADQTTSKTDGFIQVCICKKIEELLWDWRMLQPKSYY
jgi:hypothetical protein